jgi:polysaccharide biosynthesis/export protein
MRIKCLVLCGVRLVSTVLFLSSIGGLCGGQEGKTHPKELIQYVRDTVKLGLKDEQIQQNAVKAGWPVATVNDAIAYVRTVSPASDPVEIAPEPAEKPKPPAAKPTSATVTEPVKPPDAEPAQESEPRRSRDDYYIGAGDVLQISVWREPEASVPNAVVRPDGKIGLPLLKEIEVIGLTPREAEKVITARLAKLIPAADVTVVVTGINSKKLYIVGAVKKEGPIPYTYRMTVMQALSEAGGLSDYAKRKKIYILRAENGKEYRLPFDYEAVLKGERMELNIPMLPGDTLVVPQ